MKELAIYCAGGFGREIYCMIFNRIKNPEWKFIGFFDDGVEKGNQLQYGPCLGGMNDLNNWSKPLDLVIANGNPKMLKHISEGINNPNVNFPNITDCDTIFLDKETVHIGKGNIIGYSSFISCNVVIGDFNVFNGRFSIGHEAKIGNYNVFMPDVKISGAVDINNGCLFGAGSFVIQGLKIKDYVKLSPGSVLLTKPKEGKTYIGNPAELIEL